MRTPRNESARSAALGIAVGLFIGAVLFVALIVTRAAQLAAGPGTARASESTPTPTAVFLATPPIIPTPTPAIVTPSPTQSQLDKAEALLEDGDGSAALDVLIPLLDQLGSAEDLARLNTDLGRAEVLLGRFQRAAGYLEAAFALGPEPELLLDLATCYDMGGDLHTALARYLRLAAWADAPEDLRQVARDRARELVEILGTPTPVP